MSATITDFAEWRARALAAQPAKRRGISRETQDWLRAYQVTATTARHFPDLVSRYAQEERWKRAGEIFAELLALAAAIFVGGVVFIGVVAWTWVPT